MAAKRAEAAVLKACPAVVDGDVAEYLAGTAAALLEDEDMDAASMLTEFEASVAPIFEDHDVSAEDTKAFLDCVVEAAFGKATFAPPARGAQQANATAPVEEDVLCLVQNLLLMYGGSPEPLLRNTTLKLIRGHRYGVIGTNGSGKTTLMSRIAKKDIGGFPQDVNVVHLRHEAILRGINPSIPAREYAKIRNAGETAASEEELEKALKTVGFDNEELLAKAVGALSGGWQMRLALACAVAQKAQLFLLDEPTNHLDADAVRWLVGFVNEACAGGETTALIVSHDPDFLNQVCTDIIHFTSNAKLMYHAGDFDTFKKDELNGDEMRAQQLLEVGDKNDENDALDPSRMKLDCPTDRLAFPAPEKIAGASQNRPDPVVLTLAGISFRHPGAERPVLADVSNDVCFGCRIGIVGKNGSGKSTLLSLIAGRLEPNVAGERWTHEALRLVYIGQHQESHLAEFMKCTPVEYLQLRFRRGYDNEAPFRAPAPLPPKDLRRVKELARRNGKKGKEVEALLSRQHDGTQCLYEVKWKDLGPNDNSFEKTTRLKSLGLENMIEAFDSMLSAAWGLEPLRPLTEREVVRHFEDFGLPEEAACRRQISLLSSGQKVKMMLAASFWTKPHIVCLDEPTNYLDTETIEQLQKALSSFRGGFIVVSHNERFINSVCDQIWEVADGKVASKTGLPQNSRSHTAVKADHAENSTSAQPEAAATSKRRPAAKRGK